MRMHTLETRPEAGADAVKVTVSLPTYDEATDKQRRAAYDDGVFGQGMTVPVQTLMRPRMKKGMKGLELAEFAKAAFLARLNNTKLAEVTIIDARGIYYTPEQVTAIEASGAKLVNIGPEPEQQD